MMPRTAYLDQLREFIDKSQIKILTGIRRSGESSALLLLKDELMQNKVQAEQIVHINLESFGFSELLTAHKLYFHVADKILKGRKTYLLLDEIQEVEEWEKAVNSLLVDFDVDIYLTGSNSHL